MTALTKLRRPAAALLVLLTSVAFLTGCDRLRHDVTLEWVWDEEADHVLTNQTNATDELCGVTSECVEAFSSDQAIALKFANESDASAEFEAGDERVRGIFIIRWIADLSDDDKEYVVWLLENSGKSGD